VKWASDCVGTILLFDSLSAGFVALLGYFLVNQRLPVTKYDRVFQ